MRSDTLLTDARSLYPSFSISARLLIGCSMVFFSENLRGWGSQIRYLIGLLRIWMTGTKRYTIQSVIEPRHCQVFGLECLRVRCWALSCLPCTFPISEALWTIASTIFMQTICRSIGTVNRVICRNALRG